MTSKLSRYAEGIIEAAWLAAVLVVPIFFNIYSSRIFEPDKIALLRSLVLIILAAWVVKLVEERRGSQDPAPPVASRLKALLRIPLVIPVLALAVVYMISTIFSVTPATSLWGSYQRLQGTYTTFSYLVIFAAIVLNVRRRVQVERLITAVIISSLPVSLYGILQHYKIDPIPWGGDVSTRIAANMGNSIFVAAYLIMVFPLTAVRMVEAFRGLLNDNNQLLANFARATAYVFIAILQVIALYFSGSRGPWLGWLASSFFLLVVLSLLWRKRWLTFGIVGAALVLVGFLALLNIPSGPLESLRSRPELNRLGQVFDAESRTGRVRTLIWQGAVQLVLPHQPLEFPDGRKDAFNFLRPLIGYGPESMYVAYNPFYQPELTQVEKRNASPDRSHNETWDSLVITGVFGLAVYLALFGSVFYYGLKWLGLITGRSQRNLFLALITAGGVISAVILVLLQGAAYFGVALPFGMVIGLFIYLILAALFGNYQSPQTEGERLRALTIAGLLVVIVAHFIEINFGIAIVATRTYFWVFTGLLLVLGYVFPKTEEYQQVATGETTPAGVMERNSSGQTSSRRERSKVSSKKKRRAPGSSSRNSAGGRPTWLREAMIGAFLVTVIVATLGFDFTTNVQGSTSGLSIFWSSVASLPNRGVSFGILAMVLTSWLVAGVVLASENLFSADNAIWMKMVVTILGISFFLGFLFWLWDAGGLASLASRTTNSLPEVLAQVGRYEGILTRYYFYLFVLIFSAAAFVPFEWPVKASAYAWSGMAVAPLALVIALFLTSYTNLRIIQADIAFKLADPFTSGNQWPVAIAIYDRANSLAPTEDYYYLFLGRAYLEQAKTLSDPNEREQLISQAASDLRKAQALNPLNTDHTANLARLYSLWASSTSDAQLKDQRAKTSSEYFARAVTLSPNNARLWDEWALLYLSVLKQPEEAHQRLARALEIDPYYDWTYGLMGDYYSMIAQGIPDDQAEQKQKTLKQASDSYHKALSLSGSSTDTQLKYGYALALGGVESQLGQGETAISAYQQAINFVPTNTDNWRIEETIAKLYFQNGDRANALVHAQNALAGAPDDQKERLKALVAQIQGQP